VIKIDQMIQASAVDNKSIGIKTTVVIT